MSRRSGLACESHGGNRSPVSTEIGLLNGQRCGRNSFRVMADPHCVISNRTLSTELLRSYGFQWGIRAAGRCGPSIAVALWSGSFGGRFLLSRPIRRSLSWRLGSGSDSLGESGERRLAGRSMITCPSSSRLAIHRLRLSELLGCHLAATSRI